MGIPMKALTFTLIVLFSWAASPVRAATTIDSVNRYAYGANLGWLNWVADTNNGVVIGAYVCSGYIYCANVGWINLGSGSPANSIQYQNNSATDFGVNLDGLGNLSGYAWGANIGWITFEQTYGQPKVNLLTGQLSGSVWSANCGWISLSNAVAYVQTDTISPGALASDGLPIAWLLTYFGTTNVNANADPTGKGMTIGQDYLAGTDPTNAEQPFAHHCREVFVRRDEQHAYLGQCADAILLHSANAQPDFAGLGGQRLGTRFALRRFHHDGRFQRYHCADTILSRRGGSSAHTVSVQKSIGRGRTQPAWRRS